MAEFQSIYKLLKEVAREIGTCPYCGLSIYAYGEWKNSHTPIVRIDKDQIEAGFYCGNSQKEFIIIKIDRRGNRTQIFE